MTQEQFIKLFVQAFVISESEASEIKPDKFGDSPEMADELLGLILSGEKTATCSSLWEWEYDNEKIPHVGMKSLILNGKNEPKCIIETTDVIIKNYCDVDEDFANAEGEGNKSLEYWRDSHKSFFTRSLPRIDMEFREDMPLVCEKFKVVFKMSN